MRKAKNEHLIPVQIWRIYPYPDVTPPETFLVVLKGEEGKFVPISIGCPEGQYLVMAMQQVSFPRPLTHNLIQNLLSKVKGKVHQLVIHTLKDETFHAYLLIQTQDEVFYLDCRPSDGMILATLMNIPIFMSPEVMEEAGRELSSMLNLTELGEELSGVDDEGHEEGTLEKEQEQEQDLFPEATIDIAPPAEPPEPAVLEEEAPLLPVISQGAAELTQIDALRAQLDRLVAEEAYEEAARVRDLITELEAGDGSAL
ncbi:MAG: bifunctional nuclease family protein [Gemmatimonadetes bacterium]|jgi:bifunctional DNase/RNase|nr:bifunctional nuclease family protein [Gemmatimonadota bacterium]MBT7859121.1 bifunctional nuclease family protein [Gemmatimonadota bacterium]